ncbi:MAG: Fe-S protein assembly co-chaperone HscB [Archangiaceae bacterium]|nr:Fe-S protein assembly co-chaperone HscB [Archangiaceae bacterium]
MFGLTPSVDVDVPALEAKYRELSLEHHPDRVGADQRLEAVQKTTSLNEAVKVLRDPARRAFYLLQLEGIDLEKQQMPMEFLESILEQREQLEIAKRQKNLPKVRALGAEVGHTSDQALAEGLKALRAGEVPAATSALARVRYYTRFLDEVEAIEESAA